MSTLLGPYHPVVVLPEGYEVFDFSIPAAERPEPRSPWIVGRYDEVRVDVYTQALFESARCVHMGVDLGAPAGTAVHAFASGVVVHAGVNGAEGDYGPTLVTEHRVDGERLWVLLGHLSRASLDLHPPGTRFLRGEVLGWLGAPEENGGWPPHVHVQLSLRRPETFDLPGVVTLAEREAARALYPDPRQVLGPIY